MQKLNMIVVILILKLKSVKINISKFSMEKMLNMKKDFKIKEEMILILFLLLITIWNQN